MLKDNLIAATNTPSSAAAWHAKKALQAHYTLILGQVTATLTKHSLSHLTIEELKAYAAGLVVPSGADSALLGFFGGATSLGGLAGLHEGDGAADFLGFLFLAGELGGLEPTLLFALCGVPLLPLSK